MRLNTTDASERKRAREMVDAMDTLDRSIEVREKTRRVDAPQPACVPDEEVAKGRALWWDPRKKGKWSAADASPQGGVDATASD